MLKPFARKLLVIPDKYLSGFITDFYYNLTRMFCECYPGIEVEVASSYNPRERVETLIILSICHWMIDEVEKVAEIPYGTDIVLWHDDIFFRNDRCRELTHQLFDRARLIIHGTLNAYRMLYAKWVDKSSWLPLFAIPYFHKPYNVAPTNRCLLTGQSNWTHYPLRSWLHQNPHPLLDTIPHPGYIENDDGIVRENYADLLNSYYCCVMDGGLSYGAYRYQIDGKERPFATPVEVHLRALLGERGLEEYKHLGQVLFKHFEIPATGSLLLMDESVPELRDLGYVPFVNYIPVNFDDVHYWITECCNNPGKYERIRRSGWLLSKNHTEERRSQSLRSILGVQC